MNNMTKVVFSRKLKKAAWSNTKLVKGDIAEEVRKLKKTSKDITVLGSGSIVSQLTQARLVDQYDVVVVPSSSARGGRCSRGSGQAGPAADEDADLQERERGADLRARGGAGFLDAARRSTQDRDRRDRQRARHREPGRAGPEPRVVGVSDAAIPAARTEAGPVAGAAPDCCGRHHRLAVRRRATGPSPCRPRTRGWPRWCAGGRRGTSTRSSRSGVSARGPDLWCRRHGVRALLRRRRPAAGVCPDEQLATRNRA